MLRLEQLPAILWKRKAVFLITFVLVVGAAAAVTSTLDKVYTTRAYLLVSSAGGGSDFEQVQINQVVTKSYAELLQTRNFAERVTRRLSFRASPPSIQRSVDVAPVPESQLITIEASAGTPGRAAEVATTYARTFIEESRRFASPDGQSATRLVLAEPAPVVSRPTRPRPKLYMAIATLLAAMLAAGAAVLRHRTDQRLDLDATATELEGLQILGRIPRTTGSTVRRSLGLGDEQPDRAVEESFRFVLANLAFAAGGQRPSTLAVVSAGQGEGKSTTCASIARAAMEQGVETLVVDGDLRRPRLTQALELVGTDHVGLSSFLVQTEPVALSDAARPVGGTSLAVLPAGLQPPNPPALLATQALVDFTDRARRIYGLTVFDTPPMTVGADASLIAARTEGVVLVIDAERTRRGPMRQAIEQLRRANARVLGVVINRAGDEVVAYYGFDEPAGRRRGRRGGPPDEGADPSAVEVEARG